MLISQLASKAGRAGEEGFQMMASAISTCHREKEVVLINLYACGTKKENLFFCL